MPALVQIIAWCRSGDKPLYEPMMVRLLMHICITCPQSVNGWERHFPLQWHSFIGRIICIPWSIHCLFNCQSNNWEITPCTMKGLDQYVLSAEGQWKWKSFQGIWSSYFIDAWTQYLAHYGNSLLLEFQCYANIRFVVIDCVAVISQWIVQATIVQILYHVHNINIGVMATLKL